MILMARLADPQPQSAQAQSPLMPHAQAQYRATGLPSFVADRHRGWKFMVSDVRGTGIPANKPPYVSASERCP